MPVTPFNAYPGPVAYQANLFIVAGSFRPNGTGAPLDVRGKGFSVAYTSTGLWTITFTVPQTFVEPPVSKWLGWQHEAAAGITLNFGVQNFVSGPGGTKTLNITTLNNNTGAPIDVTASADRIISFAVFFHTAK